mgnify:CR=1 FL=1
MAVPLHERLAPQISGSSLQVTGVPSQLEPLQASLCVHASPSSQVGALFAACVQPDTGSQLSSVQAFPSLQGLIGRKVANRQVDSTLDLATIVLEEANVAFVPGEAFGAPGYARFSFALGIDDLVEGINRVTELVAG